MCKFTNRSEEYTQKCIQDSVVQCSDGFQLVVSDTFTTYQSMIDNSCEEKCFVRMAEECLEYAKMELDLQHSSGEEMSTDENIVFCE